MRLYGKARRRDCYGLALANRHGLVAGITGTGKSVALELPAAGFSAIGEQAHLVRTTLSDMESLSRLLKVVEIHGGDGLRHH